MTKACPRSKLGLNIIVHPRVEPIMLAYKWTANPYNQNIPP